MPRIACFGELLLRLTAPHSERLLQSGHLDVHVGGAEANVAVGLAALGHDTRMIGAVPAGPLGAAALRFLRSQGVDCSGVATRPGRMGLYFLEPGAGLRASQIVYDRAGSAFAEAPADSWNWAALLAGCDRLHLSGITPALGPGPARAAIAAAEAATAAGIAVSFDGNYRAQLWAAWDSNPRDVLRGLAEHATVLFGNHRDAALLLGREFAGDTPADRRRAAEALFDAFPRLEAIASTAREALDADRNTITARLDLRGEAHESEPLLVAGIVDRIGAGDAFAAGILHGIITAAGPKRTLDTGVALTALKHSLPGDASRFGQEDVDAFLAGNYDVRR